MLSSVKCIYHFSGGVIPDLQPVDNNNELLVTTSLTKFNPEIRIGQNDDRKMLIDCLGTALQESVELPSAVRSQELDSVSNTGDLGISIQSICSRMQQEYDLYSRTYLCSQPVTEMLPSKEFYIMQCTPTDLQ